MDRSWKKYANDLKKKSALSKFYKRQENINEESDPQQIQSLIEYFESNLNETDKIKIENGSKGYSVDEEKKKLSELQKICPSYN